MPCIHKEKTRDILWKTEMDKILRASVGQVKKKKVVWSAFQAVNFKNFAKMGAIKVELISHNTFFFF